MYTRGNIGLGESSEVVDLVVGIVGRGVRVI